MATEFGSVIVAVPPAVDHTRPLIVESTWVPEPTWPVPEPELDHAA